MIKVIFLDAEGTFLKFCKPLGEVYFDFWSKVGIEIDPLKVESSIRPLYRRIFQESLFPPLNGEICKRAWRKLFETLFSEYKNLEIFDLVFEDVYKFFASPECVEVVSDFWDFLKKGKEMGLKFGVISNWDCRLYSILEGYQLLESLEGVFIGCEIGYLKPHPFIYQKALSYFSVVPQEAIMIGDTYEDDIETPQKLGFHTYHIQGEPNFKKIWQDLSSMFSSLR